jgi:phosphatidylinositol alpha-mannosyltransferase
VRVGLVCPYSLTTPGGVQGQVLGLARSLRHAGHHARVLGPCDAPPPDAGVTPLGRSIPATANGSVAPIAPDPSCQLRTIRALRDESFDVLHLHEPLVPGPTMTAILFRNSPLIGTFHAAGGSAAYRYLTPVVRWLAGRLDQRCVVSQAARAMAHEALGGEYLLMFNGIEIDRFAKAAPWDDSIRSPSARTDGPVIFFVGRHEPRKGLDILLTALRYLPADVRVWIGGDGPETAALQAQHTGDPRLEWLGRISDEEKASRLRAADVFCAPSLRGESFGVVLLEAMAARTPIVASDLDGYRNVARSGADALLVPPGDPRALGAALREVISNPSCAEALVTSGQQRAEEFSMDNLAHRYVELYQQL